MSSGSFPDLRRNPQPSTPGWLLAPAPLGAKLACARGRPHPLAGPIKGLVEVLLDVREHDLRSAEGLLGLLKLSVDALMFFTSEVPRGWCR